MLNKNENLIIASLTKLLISAKLLKAKRVRVLEIVLMERAVTELILRNVVM